MSSLFLFIKGFIIGIGKIIPGVSGSVLAISLGIYEESISRIRNIFNNLKDNLIYFIPLSLGIILAILFGSNIILYFLNHFYLYTMTLFIGLIIGTIPSIVKKQQFKTKDWCYISIIFIIFYYLYNSFIFPEYNFSYSILDYIYVIFLGFLDAVTTIMPGISGSATYMVLGSYNFVLSIFSNPIENIILTILFGIGLLLGLYIMIRVVSHAFSHHSHKTWILIFSFLLSSLFFLILKIIEFITISNLLSVLSLLVLSYFLINALE